MPGRLPSFWIVADMFHLSEVFYWNLVRTIRAHILLGSPTPNGEIAFLSWRKNISRWFDTLLSSGSAAQFQFREICHHTLVLRP